jgi:transketolase
MALGEKLKGSDCRVFCIVGDGEAQEGQCWEAFEFAAAKKLSNLVVLLDWNKRQLDGYLDDCLPMGDFVAKFRAFGFDTVKVNGNDVDALAEAIARTRKGGDKPYAIVMDTVKGAGIPEVEQLPMNHSIAVDDMQYAKWTADLKAQLKELEG